LISLEQILQEKEENKLTASVEESKNNNDQFDDTIARAPNEESKLHSLMQIEKTVSYQPIKKGRFYQQKELEAGLITGK
jgi:hypothetical protein